MATAVSAKLRSEALGLLDKRSALLDMARELSRLMREAGVPGAVIGGIAVVLHGHLRTTKDIDVFVEGSLETLAGLLIAHGFSLDQKKQETRKPMSANYTAVVRRDGRWWIGWIEELPGVNSQGKTRVELLDNLRSALKEMLEINRVGALPSSGRLGT